MLFNSLPNSAAATTLISQIQKALPEDYQRLAAVKLDIQIRQITVKGDHATAELLYEGHFRVSTPKGGEIPKQVSDIQHMILAKDQGTWKILSGL